MMMMMMNLLTCLSISSIRMMMMTTKRMTKKTISLDQDPGRPAHQGLPVDQDRGQGQGKMVDVVGQGQDLALVPLAAAGNTADDQDHLTLPPVTPAKISDQGAGRGLVLHTRCILLVEAIKLESNSI